MECIKVLLRAGSDINATDNHLRTPKFYCLLPEGRALLEGNAVLDTTDNAKKSKKKSKEKKNGDINPKQSVRRFQKSVTARSRPNKTDTSGAVCTKVL